MNVLLKEFTENTRNTLEYIQKNGAKEYTFDIDCLDLKNYTETSICDSKYKVLFNKIKGPSLYWFDIVSSTKNVDIIAALQVYNQSESPKKTPVFNQNYSRETRTLYVGKVKKNIWVRLRQHLGYYKTHSTQGLQLYYWAPPLELKLKLHVIEFELDMAEVMPAVEQYFSLRLKPLLGKHI